MKLSFTIDTDHTQDVKTLMTFLQSVRTSDRARRKRYAKALKEDTPIDELHHAAGLFSMSSASTVTDLMATVIEESNK